MPIIGWRFVEGRREIGSKAVARKVRTESPVAMTHHPDQTYSLTDLHAHCLAAGAPAEAERLELYLALQREQARTAENLTTSVALAPVFSTLAA